MRMLAPLSRWLGCLLALIVCAFAATVGAAERPPNKLDFSAQVFPLLKRSCFECHGPEKQLGGLRLDRREDLQRGGDSGPTLVAGKPDESEILARVSLPADDPQRMPNRGERWNAGEIATLRRWIAEGAVWPDHVAEQQHWSYVKPVRPAPPAFDIADTNRANKNTHPIDRFVRARLAEEKLPPSPAAEPAVLVRRVYLDLIGIPPSPAEVAKYLNDTRADRYARLVDDLLARPQFGERWARPWLDLARYADSHGFQRDDLREIWAYRDWVIRALNADMPFDQFTIHQVAGDLIDGADDASRIATGFHRNAPTNVEAGSDPEETRINQLIDRVNTTGYVWLGTSLECAQCHDHKYDPFTMRDYYGLLAFFNQTEIEADRNNPKVPGSIRFLGPRMNLADAKVDTQRTELRRELASLDKELDGLKQAAREKLDERLAALAVEAGSKPAEEVMHVDDFDSAGGAAHKVLDDCSVLLVDDAPDKDTYTVVATTDLPNVTAIRLEALTDPSLPGNGPGRGDAERPNFVLNSFKATAGPTNAKPEGDKPVKFADAQADFSQTKYDVAGAIDDNERSAWAINPKFHEPHWAEFTFDKPVSNAGGTRFTFTMVQNFGNGRTIGRLRLAALAGSKRGGEMPADIAKLAKVDAKRRTAPQTDKLVDYLVSQEPAGRKLLERRADVDRRVKLLPQPTTLVMKEVGPARESHLFTRGDFRAPGDKIEPAAPAVLHRLPEGPKNRLTLARWLVDRDNPLVARVTVNRWWAELFGRGLVSTVEDFGIKGEPPSHRELLDWLAVEFMEYGWSTKHVLRRIVTSDTYQQQSYLTPELQARDDQNRLLARGPRVRLDAEAIRDNALAISGLLSLAGGGPPVRPFQPDGLWTKIGGEKIEYVVSPGEAKYRRGVYVVWKRGAPYPSFVNFDATARLACTVKRSRSNTPLQALTLLNDPVYVEAAEALARRVIRERPSAGVDARLVFAFRLCVARAPSVAEAAIMRRLYDDQLRTPASDDTKPPVKLTAQEWAAWRAVATALLNLDETITKG
ncbi:MAG: PSD1 domain-containing protein [Planctomycetes bacterium]|nr:PSD1 domain-containing protein [Planctomycetota bacterium]